MITVSTMIVGQEIGGHVHEKETATGSVKSAAATDHVAENVTTENVAGNETVVGSTKTGTGKAAATGEKVTGNVTENENIVVVAIKRAQRLTLSALLVNSKYLAGRPNTDRQYLHFSVSVPINKWQICRAWLGLRVCKHCIFLLPKVHLL